MTRAALTKFARPAGRERPASVQEVRLLLYDPRIERLELEPARERATDDFVRLRGSLRRDLLQGLATFKRRLGYELYLARPLHGDEPPHRLIDRSADRDQAVVLQDRRLALADRVGDPLAFVKLDRHAAKVVIDGM